MHFSRERIGHCWVLHLIQLLGSDRVRLFDDFFHDHEGAGHNNLCEIDQIFKPIHSFMVRLRTCQTLNAIEDIVRG